MTIRIPRGVLIALGLLLALGGGAALGYVVADEPTPETETVTTTRVSTVTTTQTQTITEIPAFVGMLGERVLQDLIERGEIEDAIPVDPEEGWDTEFDLGVAGGVIRFRDEPEDRIVEYEWFTTPRGRQLRDAMREVVLDRGYTPVE